MALPQDTQFYQTSGADSGFKPCDRRKFSYGQAGSPHEQTNPITHIVGGLVLSGTDTFDFASGAVTPFTFDHYGRLKTDTQLVISGGDIQIGAVELKDRTEDTRMNIGIDASGLAAAPGILPIGGEYRASDTTYTDGDAAIMQMDVNGKLRVTETALSGLAVSRNADLVAISGLNNSVVQTDDSAMPATPKMISVGGEYRATATTYADGDATILQTDQNGKVRISGGGSSAGASGSIMVGYEKGAYSADMSAQTITITGLETLTIERILKVTNITDQEVIYDSSDAGKGGTISGNVITLEYDTTSMSDSDSLQILVQYDNSQDYDLGVTKNVVQNPDPSKYVTEQVLDLGSATAPSYADIDMDGYQNASMQMELGSPAGSLWVLATNDTSASPVFQNWTGSISSMNGLGNTAGSVFLTTTDFLSMTDVTVDKIRLVVSGAPTTTDVFVKKWY